MQLLAAGVERLGPYVLCILNGDNIGFKRKGAKCGYNQFILFQDIILELVCLEELQIYSRNGTIICLSCRPERDWLELVEEDKTKGTLLWMKL